HAQGNRAYHLAEEYAELDPQPVKPCEQRRLRQSNECKPGGYATRPPPRRLSVEQRPAGDHQKHRRKHQTEDTVCGSLYMLFPRQIFVRHAQTLCMCGSLSTLWTVSCFFCCLNSRRPLA